MEKTLYQVIKKIEEVALSGVNEFFWGDVWEVEANARKYPLMVYDTNIRPHSYQNGMLTLNGDIYIVDIITNSGSTENELDIISDMIGLGVGFINHLRDKEDDYGFYLRKNTDTSIGFETFTEKWDDLVSGVKIEFQIRIPDGGSICKNVYY